MQESRGGGGRVRGDAARGRGITRERATRKEILRTETVTDREGAREEWPRERREKKRRRSPHLLRRVIRGATDSGLAAVPGLWPPLFKKILHFLY